MNQYALITSRGQTLLWHAPSALEAYRQAVGFGHTILRVIPAHEEPYTEPEILVEVDSRNAHAYN